MASIRPEDSWLSRHAKSFDDSLMEVSNSMFEACRQVRLAHVKAKEKSENCDDLRSVV